ncbi:MAG: efflux RND transporter periplasmic adaptor subunit [Acidiferrobacterales bacterium]
MKRKTRLLVAALVALTLIGAAAWYWHTRHTPSTSPSSTATTANKECPGSRVLYWTDPMMPGFKSDKPGKSPMNMDMVPVCADVAPSSIPSSGAPVVNISPAIMQNLGVRTYTVISAALPHRLIVHGYVIHDQRGLAVLVDVFDADLTWVHAGLAARVYVDALPGRNWHGTIDSVAPDIDVGTRSVAVRIRLNGPARSVRPNLFARVVIDGPANGGVFVPREALIRTGERTVVIRALGGGRFQPTAVVPGYESGNDIEIRRGLRPGNIVVVSGQFLIDSEASVRASLERMTAPTAPATNHGSLKP